MTYERMIEAVRARVNQMAEALKKLDDNTAAELTTLFPFWTPGEYYEIGYRVQFGEKLYKVVQAHTSQENWTPDAVPALYTEIAKPGEIPVWRQPTGTQDAYMMGDKVHFPDEAGFIYVSTLDNNVWQPGVFGWELA